MKRHHYTGLMIFATALLWVVAPAVAVWNGCHLHTSIVSTHVDSAIGAMGPPAVGWAAVMLLLVVGWATCPADNPQ